MTPPNHPVNFLHFLLFEEEMLVDSAAERTGLSAAQLGQLIRGEIAVTPEIASKLSNLAGTTPALWLKLQTDFDHRA